jgi:hypothetical protein
MTLRLRGGAMNRLEVIGERTGRFGRGSGCVKHTVGAKNTNFALVAKGEYFFFTRVESWAVGPQQRRRCSGGRKNISTDEVGALKRIGS